MGRQCIATASLLATMERKRKLQASNNQPRAASTERTGSSSPILNQYGTLLLLHATKAGQERSSSTPCSFTKNPHLASTAVLGSFIVIADEGEERTYNRRFIEEDDIASRRTSLRPPEQR
jgi:hypothetical protein